MKGTHEFKVTVQPKEGTESYTVRVEYLAWSSKRLADKADTTWIVDGNKEPSVENIRDALLASCDWLGRYIEKKAARKDVDCNSVGK